MAFGMFSRHWSVWRAAWQAESSGQLGTAPGGHSTEFLPAVLEIQQAPPSPIGRAILWTILVVFTAGVLWATFGWIDIVATAQGKIIPSGYSKVIQPYEAGVIAAIHVQNGQAVKKGDVLIELDPTLNRADRDRASNEYRAAKVEAARLRALIAGSPTFDAPPDGEPPYVLLQRQLLRDQLAEYQARAASAQHLIDQRKAGLDQTRENIRRLEATVPMEAERADAYKKLLDHDAVTKMDFLQAEGQRIDKTQELAGQRKKLMQDQSALAEAEKNYRVLVSEFQQSKQAELSTIETKVASLVQDVTKAGQKADFQRLTTPIDGVVQQVAVHTVGGVVNPGEPIMLLVPEDDHLMVETRIAPQSIDQVHLDQTALIRFVSFNQRTTPELVGKVTRIAADLSRDPQTGESYFSGRLDISEEELKRLGGQKLVPGMPADVQIRTVDRTVLSYLLKPVEDQFSKAFRER